MLFANFNSQGIKQLVQLAKKSLNMSLQIRSHGLQVKKKPDNTIVTNADIEVSKMVVSELKKIFGTGIKVVSEESDTAVEDGDAHFLIDPIDGTSSYAKGGVFTFNLAYVKKGVPVVGIIACSLTRKIFYGYSGTVGYYVIDSDRYVEMNKDQLVNDGNMLNVVVSKRISLPGEEKEIFGKIINRINSNDFLINSIQQISASVKYSYLITGKANLAVVPGDIFHCEIYSPEISVTVLNL